MNVTLTSLEALILKATNESLPYPDLAALEAFVTIMRESSDGPQLAAQVLAARIHSTNMKEVMLTLSFVDRCMRRGDPYFQAEIGKFRFLNEMIKLVSPKYLADRTAPEVRGKVLQVLHAWSLEYPKENKFKVAYEMLKFQGVIKETPPPLPPEDGGPGIRQIKHLKNTPFEDSDKAKILQRLLQSKNPVDIQYANKLIKNMVREEERRDAASIRRTSEISAARSSALLLKDMLKSAEVNPPTQEEEMIMQELYVMCHKLSFMYEQDGQLVVTETYDENLGEVLEIIPIIYDIEAKYKKYQMKKIASKIPVSAAQQPQVSSSDSLLDFAGVGSNSPNDQPKTNITKKNTIDVLGDIFSTDTGNAANDVTMVAQPLKPVNLKPNEDVDLLGENVKKEGWNELDSLGELLLKQSLPENARRVDNFNSKPKNKIPMNALTSPKHEPTTSNGTLFDLDFFTKKPEEPTSPELPKSNPDIANDDVIVDITTNNNNTPDDLILDFGDDNIKNENLNKEATNNMEKVPKSPEIKPLTDINVTLQSVTPSKVPPLTLFEEEGGLTVVLHFCKDKPRADVNVVVISTTSKNSSQIEDYKFQGVVPKGCKIRLLTPSGTSLPACNPFLPPPALTQVMLIARSPTSPPVNLKFVITYTCDDETCSEMGEVKQLPLDDI